MTRPRLGVGDDPPTVSLDSAGTDDTSMVPWAVLFRRRLARRVGIDRRWAVVLVVLAGLFTVSCTITILVVSLDRIADDLHSEVRIVNWAITGPMLAFAVVGPAFGKAGDMWGHKRLFVGGLFVAGVFAVATALAWNAASMIAFRIVSASAGSACGPAAMAYINRLFEPEQRVRPLSYWSFVSAGAPVIGVVLGASLVEAHGWRVIFWGQAPLCFAGVALAVWLLPDTDRVAGVRFDVAGALTLGLGALSILTAISQLRQWGVADARTVLALAVGVSLLVVFAMVERRAAQPLVVLRWFKTRNIALPVLTQTLSNCAYMGAFILIPQFLTRGLGMRETEFSGLITARPITFALAAPLGGVLAVRFGERVMGVAGTAIVAGSMLIWLGVDRPDQHLAVIIGLALSGLGLGISFPALTSLTTNAVDSRDVGVAGAMQQLMTQLGAVIGATVFTTIALSGTRTDLSPFHLSFVVAACVAAVGIISAWGVRSTPREPQP